MRTLVVGAGAIGGYFGGRLLEAKQDATFLVRPRRAAELAASGLVIRSVNGDVTVPHPPVVLAKDLHSAFDVILLSCKAYDLDGAMESLAPAVGEQTVILPLLNGMKHLDLLAQRFGSAHVLGGLCMISSTLEPGGIIAHQNNLDILVFGERDGSRSPRAEAIAAEFGKAKFKPRLSENILHAMWEKWVFISSAAGITCLMRASVGDVVTAGAADICLAMLDECVAIAASHGFPPSAESDKQNRRWLTYPGSTIMASMLRDIERQAPTEADHIIGDLLRRGEEKGITNPMLRVAYAHLRAYAARREREAAARK